MGKNGRLPPEKGSRGERDAHGRLWKHLWYTMGSHHLPPTSAKSVSTSLPTPRKPGARGAGTRECQPVGVRNGAQLREPGGPFLSP